MVSARKPRGKHRVHAPWLLLYPIQAEGRGYGEYLLPTLQAGCLRRAGDPDNDATCGKSGRANNHVMVGALLKTGGFLFKLPLNPRKG